MFEFLKAHRYYLFSTGTKMKARYFDTRNDAEEAMYKYCNDNGVRFYINRI